MTPQPDGECRRWRGQLTHADARLRQKFAVPGCSVAAALDLRPVCPAPKGGALNSKSRHAARGMAEPAEQRQPRAAQVNVLQCAQCGTLSSLYASGWRGYRTDDPERGEAPALAFFCPTCSARQFDAK
jgi:hypothetical protein